MNIENMKKVRDCIAASPEYAIPNNDPLNVENVEFNMTDFINTMDDSDMTEYPNSPNHCRTIACIAGFATLLHCAENSLELTFDNHPSGKNYLDLSVLEADMLFYAKNHFGEYEKNLPTITKEEAVAVLDIAIETGEINWRKAIDQCKEET